MTKNELLELVAEALEFEGTINTVDKIEGIEGWDSLGRLAVLSLLDELGMEIDGEKFSEITTVKEFIELVNLDG